eukprot:3494583-Alexandrium_andersonii.AAC.1
MPALFESLGHSNVKLRDGDSPLVHGRGLGGEGILLCRQGEEAWMPWKAGAYGDVSLSCGVVEFAKIFCSGPRCCEHRCD